MRIPQNCAFMFITIYGYSYIIITAVLLDYFEGVTTIFDLENSIKKTMRTKSITVQMGNTGYFSQNIRMLGWGDTCFA